MVQEGICRVLEIDRHDYVQHRVVPNRRPHTRLFEDGELEIVDRVIAELRPNTATEVSELSHETEGLKVARMRGIIPYESVYLTLETGTGEGAGPCG